MILSLLSPKMMSSVSFLGQSRLHVGLISGSLTGFGAQACRQAL
jgi:hypothetical protein